MRLNGVLEGKCYMAVLVDRFFVCGAWVAVWLAVGGCGARLAVRVAVRAVWRAIRGL